MNVERSNIKKKAIKLNTYTNRQYKEVNRTWIQNQQWKLFKEVGTVHLPGYGNTKLKQSVYTRRSLIRRVKTERNIRECQFAVYKHRVNQKELENLQKTQEI